MQVKYNIYPSLLDAFQRYLDTTIDNFMYIDECGKYHMNYSQSTDEYLYSVDEVEELSKQYLLDRINRKPYKNDAVTKGTMFNELIDCFVTGVRSPKLEVTGSRKDNCIRCTMDDTTIDFDFAFVESVAGTLKGAVNQVYTQATLNTDYGEVMLYGFIDEILCNKIIDIKTASRYTFGDYANKWQRYVYPYCLTESGKVNDIESFIYRVVQLKGGTKTTPLITGVLYDEIYTYNHQQAKHALKAISERFIEFLETNKHLITDKKIFNM